MYTLPLQDHFEDGLTSVSLEGYYKPQILPMEPATYPYVAPTNDPTFYSTGLPLPVNEPFYEKPRIDITNEDFNPAPFAYITGSVIDKEGKPVSGVTMAFRLTGSGTDATTPELLEGSVYGFEATAEQIANYSVFFRAKGYIPHDIPLDILIDHNSVTLTEDKGQFPLWIILAIVAAVYVYRKKTKKVGAFGTADLMPIFLLVGGVIAFDVIRKTLEGLGIWNDKESKDLDQLQSNPNSAWSPLFWKQKPANIPWSYALTTAQAQVAAGEIYDSFGWVNDDEEQAKAVFRGLRTKANLSFIADVFQQMYSKDLLDFLRGNWWPQDRLSDSDVAEINRYIQQLPNY